MGSFSLTHWLVIIVYLIVFIVPVRRILSKAGYNGWWAILAVVPLANIGGLWIFASANWPRLEREK